MAIAVVTKASGGMPVIDVTATKPGLGVPVTEATNGGGIAVTKVSLAVGGLPVTFVADSNYWPPAGGGTTYVTWDAATVTAVTLSGGNLVATNTGTTSNNQGARVAASTAKSTGKYYFEIAFTTLTSTGANSNNGFGVGTTASSYTNLSQFGTDGVTVAQYGGVNASGSYLGNLVGQRASGDVIGIAVDLDNRKVWFRVAPSGNWNNNATYNPATNTGGSTIVSGSYTPVFISGGLGGTASNVVTANFGASAFTGAVPSGFTAGWPVDPAPPVTYATFGGFSSAGVVVSGGGLTVTHGVSSASVGSTSAAYKTTGKYYLEVGPIVSVPFQSRIGIITSAANNDYGSTSMSANTTSVLLGSSNDVFSNGSDTTKDLGGPVTIGDIYGIAIDLTARLAWLRRNGGNWNGDPAADPAIGVGGVTIGAGSFAPFVRFASGTATDAFVGNFGASTFSGAVPSGFTAGWPV